MQFSTLATTVLCLVALTAAQCGTPCVTLNGGRLGETDLVECPQNTRCIFTSSGNTNLGGVIFYQIGTCQ